MTDSGSDTGVFDRINELAREEHELWQKESRREATDADRERLRELQALLDQDPLDMTKVETKVREVAQLHADLRIARLRTIEQGKALLTPEQKARLLAVLGGGRLPRQSAGVGPRL